jgi:hypothetical protein
MRTLAVWLWLWFRNCLQSLLKQITRRVIEIASEKRTLAGLHGATLLTSVSYLHVSCEANGLDTDYW